MPAARLFVAVTLLSSLGLFAQSAQNPSDRTQYDQVVGRARQLLLDKKPKEAVAESERAIRMDESRWEAYVTAASGYTGMELFDDAIGMLQMALPRAPEERKSMIRDALRETRQAANRQTSSGAGTAQLQPPRDVPAPKPMAGTSVPAPTQAEVVLWKSIENSTAAADYEGYLKQYPNGVYAGVARTRLADLAQRAARAEEETLWHSIENSNNEDDYRAYLRKFPNGTFAELARSRVERAEWIRISNDIPNRNVPLSTNIAELQQFIQAYPGGQYAAEARTRLADILQQQEQQKQQQKQQEQVAAEEAKQREEIKRAGTFKQAAFSGSVPGYLVFDREGYRFEPFNSEGSPVAARKEQVDRIRVTGVNSDKLEVRLKNGNTVSYFCAKDSQLLSKQRMPGSCLMHSAYQAVMDIWAAAGK
jgi:tetratricopeptide (TPR) repeat protein